MFSRSWWPALGVLAATLVGCGGGADGDRNPVVGDQPPSSFRVPEGFSPATGADGQALRPRIKVHSDAVVKLRQGRGPNFPTTDGGLEATGAVYGRTGSTRTGVAGTFDITVNPDLSFSMAEDRSAAAQGDKYLLPVHQFFRNRVQPQSIRRTPGGNLEIVIRFDHPFAAPPDLVQPPTSTKRADLHIFNVWAGFLVNGSESYFGGSATTNTRALVNADSYRQVTGMVNVPVGTTANTFPGKLISDISAGNADPATDNYDPQNHGWIGSAVQAPRGFGVFAQGASRDITFNFDPEGVGGPVSLRGIIMADYTDPRGGTTPAEKRASRLPDPLDPTRLRYVLPHGAGDLQKLVVSPSGSLPTDTSGGIDVNVQITDLDADAPVAGAFPNEFNLSEIAVASGIQSVSLSAPALTAGEVQGTESAGSGSGLPGSPKRWAVPLNNANSAAEGVYPGFVKVVDAESAGFGSEFYLNLDESLSPLPTPLPIQAFQAVNINVGGATGTENIIEANQLAVNWEDAFNDFITDPARAPAAPGPMTNFQLWDVAVDPTNHDYWIIWSGDGALNWGGNAGFTGPAMAVSRIAFDPVTPGGIDFYPIFIAYGFGALPPGGFKIVMTDERYLAFTFTLVDGASFFNPPDPMLDGRVLLDIYNMSALTFEPPFTFAETGLFIFDEVPDPQPVHQVDLGHAFALFDHDFDRDPTMPNTGQHNDLMVWMAVGATYAETPLPTDFTGQVQGRLLDIDNAGIKYTQAFYLVGPNSMENTFDRGAGDCAVQVENVGGVDGPDNEDAVFVADNTDSRVETYTALNDDPALAITCLSRNSPAIFTDMFGLSVSKDNSVFVIDRGGTGATSDRLTALNSASLGVRGTANLAGALNNDIGDPPVPMQGVAVAMEADESEFFPTGDQTTVAVLHTAGIDEFVIEVP